MFYTHYMQTTTRQRWSHGGVADLRKRPKPGATEAAAALMRASVTSPLPL